LEALTFEANKKKASTKQIWRWKDRNRRYENLSACGNLSNKILVHRDFAVIFG